MKTHVKFLMDETIAKTKLMSTQKIKSMSLAERMEYLAPYKNTSQLIQETTNLKPSEKDSQHFKLEYISSGHKDTFSALEYGLWAISKKEELYYRNLKAKKRDIRKMLMYN
jgi:hypothetical protein